MAGSEALADRTMHAFNNIEKRNYYPQVFIPFYDALKQAGKIGNEKPVLVIGAEHLSSYPGYILEDGKLKETGFMIDEAYAKQHEVWCFPLMKGSIMTGK